MRLIIQRVNKASVKVVKTNKTVGVINKGFFILFGIQKGDTQKQADELAQKLLKLRIMADNQDRMNLNIKDAKGEILLISQFTLYADTKGGNRPSFINAEEPTKAKILYDYFVEKLKICEVKVETGSFGNYMQISCELDGPVTIILDS